MAKQSRIKSIAWHLRWHVRTRADISLRPSGLVRPRTDIKLRPSVFVRTRTDFKLQTVGLGDHKRTDTRASIRTNPIKLSFGCFLNFKFLAKKRPNDNLKRFVLILALVSVLPNPTVCNLKSVLVLTNTLGRNLISVLGLTNPLGCRLISALVLTCHLKCQAILLILFCLAAPFFNSSRLFLFSISLVFVSNHPLLKYL